MLISKLDLTFFSPHRKGVGFRGDYETDAFVFKIPARSLLLEPNPNIKASTYVYLKFSFIYDVDIFDKNRKYISVGKNNYGDLVIVPSKLKLNQISMHTSRKGNTKFDRYIEQLSRH